MTAIIISITFILAGILNVMTEIEKVRRTRFIFLLVGSLLFFVAGFFTGVYYH